MDESGTVDRYEILATEPAGVFDDAVVKAFVDSASYAPGLITRHPVKAELIAEVTFEPGAQPETDFSLMGGAAPEHGVRLLRKDDQ